MKIQELHEKLFEIYYTLTPKQIRETEETAGRSRYWLRNTLQNQKRAKIDTLAAVADAMGYKVELGVGDEWTDCDGMRQMVKEKVRSSQYSPVQLSIKMGYSNAVVSEIICRSKSKMKLEMMEDIMGMLGYRIDIRLTKKEDA